MRIQNNPFMNINLKQHKERKVKINTNTNMNKKMNIKENKKFALNTNSKNLSFLLMFFIVVAGLVLISPEVLALGEDTKDAGLNTSVTNLLAILNNKLTPVVLIAGCLASLIYSFAIAQPKPFILGLVTLCAFGFARAWIAGTYALIG